MKKTFLKLLALILIISFTGCQKRDDSALQIAKGKIITITNGCNYENVLIELEFPKTLGSLGTFCENPIAQDKKCIDYKNSVTVPYFSKIGISTELQKVGTTLTFKYNELRNDEYSLFTPKMDGGCLAIFMPPQCKKIVITEILEVQ